MTNEEKTELLQELMNKLLSQDKAYAIDGTPMLTVKLEDGTFRKKPAAATEYFPLAAYVGQVDTILCFTPEDPQEGWASIEIAARYADDIMPSLLEDMQGWAKARFMAGDTSRGMAIDTIPSVPALLQAIWLYETEDQQRALDGDDDALAALPTFGMF